VWWETIASTDCLLSRNMCAKHYENPTMLSQVTAKNVGDVLLRHTVDTFHRHNLIAQCTRQSSRSGARHFNDRTFAVVWIL